MIRSISALAVAGILATFVAPPAHAQSGSIVVPGAYDSPFAYDEERGIVFVATSTGVQRIRLATGTVLAPIALPAGTYPTSLDLSPDWGQLAIADRYGGQGGPYALVAGADGTGPWSVPFTYGTSDTGSASAAYLWNGALAASTGGWHDLHVVSSLVLAPGRSRGLGRGTMQLTSGNAGIVLASGDRSTLLHISSYSPASWGWRDLLRHQGGASPVTVRGAAQVASIDETGERFAIQGSEGVIDVYRRDFTRIGSMAVQRACAGSTAYFSGFAFHPVTRELIVGWSGTHPAPSCLTVHGPDSLVQRDELQVPATRFANMRLSRDGSLAMYLDGDTLRYRRMYAPLAAQAVTVTVPAGQSTPIALQGSIGNGGSLRYYAPSRTSRGRVQIEGWSATYTPAPGFVGTDSFTYTVMYGRAKVAARVTVNVQPAVQVQSQRALPRVQRSTRR